jgi:hypothetical protein
MLKMFPRTKRWVFIAALCISAGAMTGCLESSFDLASESRLPQGIALPTGLNRADVSVTLDFYTMGLAKFTLRDKTGKKLATVTGKTKGDPIYLKSSPQGPDPTGPGYELVVINGVTEIMECRPYREHENMEQNGRIVALFNVIDEPSIREQILSRQGVQ